MSTTLHHVYEFATREGRTVRFEEAGGPRTTVEGDIVPVHYTAAHPNAPPRTPRAGAGFWRAPWAYWCSSR